MPGPGPVFFHEGQNRPAAQPVTQTGNAAQDWLSQLTAELKARGENNIKITPAAGFPGMYNVQILNPALQGADGRLSPGGASFMVDPSATKYTPADWAAGQVDAAYQSVKDAKGLGTLSQGFYDSGQPPSTPPPGPSRTPNSRGLPGPGGGLSGPPPAPVTNPPVLRPPVGSGLPGRPPERPVTPPSVGLNAEGGGSFPVIGGGQEQQVAQQVAQIQRVPGLQQIMQAANPYSMAAFGLRRR